MADTGNDFQTLLSQFMGGGDDTTKLMQSIFEQLNKPPSKAPTWQHILGAFLTGDPLAVTKFENLQQEAKTRKMKELLTPLEIMSKLSEMKSKMAEGKPPTIVPETEIVQQAPPNIGEDMTKTEETGRPDWMKSWLKSPGKEKELKGLKDLLKPEEQETQLIEREEGVYRVPKKGEPGLVGGVPGKPGKEETKTKEQKNYEFTMKQRTEAGLPTISFEDWQIQDANRKEKTNKRPYKESYDEGDIHYTEHYDKDGNLIKISKAPRWQPEKDPFREENVKKMYTQYNQGRAKAKNDPFRMLMADMMKGQGIILDPSQDWPAFTYDQFKKYVTTGEAPITKDKYGFMKGETIDKNGKTYEYIGENKWKELILPKK